MFFFTSNEIYFVCSFSLNAEWREAVSISLIHHTRQCNYFPVSPLQARSISFRNIIISRFNRFVLSTYSSSIIYVWLMRETVWSSFWPQSWFHTHPSVKVHRYSRQTPEYFLSPFRDDINWSIRKKKIIFGKLKKNPVQKYIIRPYCS
jgi:hypothetical protein